MHTHSLPCNAIRDFSSSYSEIISSSYLPEVLDTISQSPMHILTRMTERKPPGSKFHKLECVVNNSRYTCFPRDLVQRCWYYFRASTQSPDSPSSPRELLHQITQVLVLRKGLNFRSHLRKSLRNAPVSPKLTFKFSLIWGRRRSRKETGAEPTQLKQSISPSDTAFAIFLSLSSHASTTGYLTLCIFHDFAAAFEQAPPIAEWGSWWVSLEGLRDGTWFLSNSILHSSSFFSLSLGTLPSN